MLINALDPYVSTEDIEKGTIWRTEIAAKLEETDCGILCVTPQNLHSEWMHFEAGALSKRVTETRVCTFMMGTTAADLGTSPLSNFQHTMPDKDDFLRLLRTLNNFCGNLRSDDNALEKVFDKFWEDISGRLDNIRKDIAKSKPKAKEKALPETTAAGQISPAVVDEVLSRLRGLERQQSQIINKISIPSEEESLYEKFYSGPIGPETPISLSERQGKKWESIFAVIETELMSVNNPVTVTKWAPREVSLRCSRDPGLSFRRWAKEMAHKAGFILHFSWGVT